MGALTYFIKAHASI